MKLSHSNEVTRRYIARLDERGLAVYGCSECQLHSSTIFRADTGRETYFYSAEPTETAETIAAATAYYSDDREFHIFTAGADVPTIFFFNERLADALRKRLTARNIPVRQQRQYKIFPPARGTSRPDGAER